MFCPASCGALFWCTGVKPAKRSDALALGAPRYNTGKPCKHGHRVDRITLDGRCVECVRIRSNIQYHSNPEKHRQARAERRFRNFVPYLLYIAKVRARRQGLPFTLTPEDIHIPTVCPVLGIPMVRDGVSTPSIDRLVAERGYVPGNVVIVSSRANRLRNDASVEELRAIVSFYERLLQPHEHG